MMFKSRSNYGFHAPSPYVQYHFPKTEFEYGYVKDVTTGRNVVGIVGETNVYKHRQEAMADTLLSTLIQRLQKGDTSAIGDVVGGFVDLTTMPKNLMEAQNLMLFADRYFETLPTDVKQKYQNNLGKFLQDVDIALKAQMEKQAQAVASPTVEKSESEVKSE